MWWFSNGHFINNSSVNCDRIVTNKLVTNWWRIITDGTSITNSSLISNGQLCFDSLFLMTDDQSIRHYFLIDSSSQIRHYCLWWMILPSLNTVTQNCDNRIFVSKPRLLTELWKNFLPLFIFFFSCFIYTPMIRILNSI